MSRRASSTTSSATDSRSSPSTASSPDRRGRIPAGFVVLAALGVALVALPLFGPDTADAVVPHRRRSSRARPRSTALRLSLVVASTAAAISFVLGFPLAWVLVRSDLPRQDPRARDRRPPARDAPGGRRRGSARGVRAADGLLGSWLYDVVRHPAHLHDRRGRARRHVRVVPARRARARGRTALASTRGSRTRRRRSAPRAGTSCVGSRSRSSAPQIAAGARPVVGARARRVRGDDHVRREPAGTHADAAARGLRAAADATPTPRSPSRCS